jgi:hypothetical protein
MWLYSGDQSSDARGAPRTLMPLDFHGSFALGRLLQSREVGQHFSVSSCTVTTLGQDVREFAPVLRYYCDYCDYCLCICFIEIIAVIVIMDVIVIIKIWLGSICLRVVYELDHKNPILYVIPIQSILGKLPVVPVGDTGTIPHHLRHHFPGAPGDCRQGSGDGCRMWFVNLWALGWSSDM